MSTFNYNDYQTVVSRAQGATTTAVKVGFFKLKNDKDEALIRINVSSMDDLQFATVHQLGAAQKWMKVSCHNPVGSYADTCPLCRQVAAGDTAIGKASKKVYVQMLISYKDPVTNQFSTAIPVIWERPAGFAREIANLLRDYGNLKERVFKVTRNGAAGSMQTTYSIAYIPLFDKPEAVSTDFSAFNNFNISKHSYWEKSIEDIETFLATGEFPEVVKAQAEGAYVAPQTVTPAATVKATPVAQPTYVAPTPVVETPVTPVTPATEPVVQPATERPTRNFGGFSF
jgi:hypothetical protein